MAMMGFDTLKLSKQLAEAGMDSRQAEVLAQSFADILASKILDGQFATKQDLKNAIAEQMKEIDSLFAETEERLHRQLMQSQMVLLAIMLAALGLATTLILMN